MSTMPSLYLCLLAAVLASVAAHPTISGAVPGGETEKDPADYKDLAEESFEKYRTTEEATRSTTDFVIWGISEENPDKPEYKKLAEESFEKYRKTLTGGVINVTDIKVTKVTTQVFYGSKTGIDFTVIPANGESITCHSDIWEQSCLHKKGTDVNCQNN